MNDSTERDYKRYCERYARDYHCTVEEAGKTAICAAYRKYLEERECTGIYKSKKGLMNQE